MVDLSKFEKIDGREALRRLLDGKTIYNRFGGKYLLDGTIFVFIRKSGAYETTNDGLRMILEEDWYIPKPFDVRKTLVKNPNKWVAAYLGQECPHWFKVGFDIQTMSVCTLPLKENGDVGSKYVDYPDDISLEEILDLCIDLNDVPTGAC